MTSLASIDPSVGGRAQRRVAPAPHALFRLLDAALEFEPLARLAIETLGVFVEHAPPLRIANRRPWRIVGMFGSHQNPASAPQRGAQREAA